MSRSSRLQCRQFEVQTISAAARDAVLAWYRDHGACRIAWAEHPAEGNKPAHFHVVARFDKTVDCNALRELVNTLDKHSHADKVNRWPNMVRYLRHLDSPEKTPIPAEACHYEGFPEAEMDQATFDNGGCLNLIRMIAELPHSSSPVDALRVCVQAGFRPFEVSGVSRALFDLGRLLSDGSQVGIHRKPRSVASEAPSAPVRLPQVVFDPYCPDPAFFASDEELDATIPHLDE